MNLHDFFSKELQKLSIVDMAFVKTVYFIFGLLMFSLYPSFMFLDWWVYFVLAILSAAPLYLYFFSQKGSYFEKAETYLKNNNPSNQFLLFMAMFFFACMMGVIIPILVNFVWWQYIAVMLVLAIKPLQKTWCW